MRGVIFDVKVTRMRRRVAITRTWGAPTRRNHTPYHPSYESHTPSLSFNVVIQLCFQCKIVDEIGKINMSLKTIAQIRYLTWVMDERLLPWWNMLREVLHKTIALMRYEIEYETMALPIIQQVWGFWNRLRYCVIELVVRRPLAKWEIVEQTNAIVFESIMMRIGIFEIACREITNVSAQKIERRIALSEKEKKKMIALYLVAHSVETNIKKLRTREWSQVMNIQESFLMHEINT